MSWESAVQNWWPIVASLLAVYALHVYRRARITEPPDEARGGFWGELRAWATIDAKRTFGFVAGVLGGIVVAAKLGGFSIMALTSLDPVVVTNLVVVALSALHLTGLQLPPIVWGAVLGAVFLLSLLVGDFWRNRRNR